ncbi:MAG TPA: hypothetical protein VHR47_08090 [Bacillota bacterium]|nr:hypothetical protein [Bacillota bacterium]
MKKTLLAIVVLSMLTAAGIYFGLPKHPETPPPYYSGVLWPYFTMGQTYTTVYPDGSRRIYVYEHNQPVGSRLLNNDEELIEESTYGIEVIRGMPTVKIVETKYYDFQGYLLIYFLPGSLILAALCLLVLAFEIIWGLLHKKLSV